MYVSIEFVGNDICKWVVDWYFNIYVWVCFYEFYNFGL